MSEHTEYIRTVSKILFAYTEGKTIQCLNKGEWEDVKEDKLYTLLKGIDSELPFSQVRVKTEEIYRPFQDGDEMVNEFCNRFEKPHEKKASFYMWVKDKELNVRYLVSGITDHTVMLQNGARPDWNELLQKYSFMDNSPCGVVEKRL